MKDINRQKYEAFIGMVKALIDESVAKQLGTHTENDRIRSEFAERDYRRVINLDQGDCSNGRK